MKIINRTHFRAPESIAVRIVVDTTGWLFQQALSAPITFVTFHHKGWES